jgi:hypothetical protein
MVSESPSNLPPQPRIPTKRAADNGLLFVSRQSSIFRGSEHIATAVSKTMAKRIANALNVYKPNREGV